jgi:hypothetical protein
MTTHMPGIDATLEPTRKARKGSLYTDEERVILGKYKAAYKATTTHSQRDALLRGSIFPEIFNYWFQKEQIMPIESEIVIRRKVAITHHLFNKLVNMPQNLCQWIRNNWHLDKSVAAAVSTQKKSIVDIMWQEKKDEVRDEIRELYTMGGGEGEPATGDVFQL